MLDELAISGSGGVLLRIAGSGSSKPDCFFFVKQTFETPEIFPEYQSYSSEVADDSYTYLGDDTYILSTQEDKALWAALKSSVNIVSRGRLIA